jgi:predicted Zn finger-like uncharacterized protein
MKFNCPQCNKPYLIADERVRGKILKIRCKNCSTVITVREGMEPAGPVGPRPRPSSAAAASAQGRPMTEPVELTGRDLGRPETAQRLSSSLLEADDDALPPLDDEWYVSVDGVQEGPFSLDRARDWVAGRGSEDEVYCWRDTFDDWLPIEDVADLQNARRVSKLALRAPPVGKTPSPNAMRAPPERAVSAPDADLFGGEDESMTTIDPRPFIAMGERPPAPGPAVEDEADDEPIVRLIVADDDGAPALPTERPVQARPLNMPGIASASADQASAAPRAWLSDALSGPQPALRLPAPYPTMSAAHPAGAAPAPARSGRRVVLVVALVLAVIASGLGAFLLVRKLVGTDGGSFWPGDTADSALPPLRPEDVSAALQRPESQSALKHCYDRARQDSPELEIGRIDLDLTVSPGGQVERVSLSHHAETAFGACLLDSIRTWTFDASSAGVTARIPLIFGS